MKKTGIPIDRRFKEWRDLKTKYSAFVGSIGTDFFKQGFVRQGFIPEERKEDWQKRKLVKGVDPGGNRAILVKSGLLKRSVRVTELKPDRVSWGSDKPYAQLHNEGGTITGTATVRSHWRKNNAKGKNGKRKAAGTMVQVKAHSRKMNTKMPKRQFMGESRLLMRRIEMQTLKKLKDIFEK
jgi:phage gpG-like protein